MTPLGLLNFLVLQWFGVRLARCVDHIGSTHSAWPYTFLGSRLLLGGKRWRCVGVDVNGATLRRYTILRWIWPLTGWWSDYRWIARRS